MLVRVLSDVLGRVGCPMPNDDGLGDPGCVSSSQSVSEPAELSKLPKSFVESGVLVPAVIGE